MEKLPLILLVLSAVVYTTVGLRCSECTYVEPPKEFADAGITLPDFGSGNASQTCKDGSTSMMTSECGTADEGEKNVCMRAKATVTLTLKAGGKDLKMLVYSRSCYEVLSSEPDEGTIPAAELQDDIDDLLRLFRDAVTVKKVDGSAVYCSTDECGDAEDLSKLSGVAAIVPSMLMVPALALLARLF